MIVKSVNPRLPQSRIDGNLTVCEGEIRSKSLSHVLSTCSQFDPLGAPSLPSHFPRSGEQGVTCSQLDFLWNFIVKVGRVPDCLGIYLETVGRGGNAKNRYRT